MKIQIFYTLPTWGYGVSYGSYMKYDCKGEGEEKFLKMKGIKERNRLKEVLRPTSTTSLIIVNCISDVHSIHRV